MHEERQREKRKVNSSFVECADLTVEGAIATIPFRPFAFFSFFFVPPS
jgi:hypothetical protein